MVSPAQDFTYDALYRLVRAEGREGIGLASFGSDDNWNDSGWMESVPMPSNTNAVQRYIQKYRYDKAGNITQLQHIADSGSFTRDFDIESASNRLKDTVVGSDSYSYTYDGRGNMTSMPHLSAMDYDSLNQMSYIESGTTKAWYQYSGGQRIRKMTDGGAERIYLGSFEYYRERDGSGVITLERTTVHVGDDSGRIGMLEVRTIGSDAAPASLKRFIYSNHLQSATLELDESGNIISYEEYHPYGTTAYQAMNSDIDAVAKRYRFTGKERDEESGLSYHRARYYIPWLCRWAAVDPLESKYAGLSPYNYCFNNPVMHTDSSGMGPEDGKSHKKDEAIGGWYQTPGGTYKFFKGDLFGHDFAASGIKGHFAGHVHGLDYEYMNNGKKRSIHPHTYKAKEVSHKNSDPNAISTSGSAGSHTSFPISSTPALPTTSTEKHGVGLTLGKVADVVTDFIPVVGGAKDIYKGFRDGNYLQAGIGIASVIFDVFTFGGGSLIKGGVKTLLKEGAEHTAGGLALLGEKESSNLWKVGEYDKIKGLEKGLDAHHVGQQKPMKYFIEGYDKGSAPSILVPALGHTSSNAIGRISTKWQHLNSVRDVIARDIRELRRIYKDIPNEPLQRLIEMNKQMYPTHFIK